MWFGAAARRRLGTASPRESMERRTDVHREPERFVVFFLFGGADVAAGRDYLAVLAHVIERGGFARGSCWRSSGSPLSVPGAWGPPCGPSTVRR